MLIGARNYNRRAWGAARESRVAWRTLRRRRRTQDVLVPFRKVLLPSTLPTCLLIEAFVTSLGDLFSIRFCWPTWQNGGTYSYLIMAWGNAGNLLHCYDPQLWSLHVEMWNVVAKTMLVHNFMRHVNSVNQWLCFVINQVWNCNLKDSC